MKQAIAALTLGALIGVFVGMSVSPVVASVVAALLTLVAAVLGVKAMGNTDAGTIDQAGLDRLASSTTAFAIACLVGAFGGLYARTHDLFAPVEEAPQDVERPDLEELADALNEIEDIVQTRATENGSGACVANCFDKEGMRRVLLHRKFESWPAGLIAVGLEPVTEETTNGTPEGDSYVTAFYNAMTDACDNLRDREDVSFPEIAKTLKRFELIKKKEEYNEDLQGETLKQVHKMIVELVCD